ncbi:hypothetical protein PHYBOEH_003751 [Phytophthora boehmeriae]|uniref:Tyrosine specific protein phosphatases domain-containing protein n=1 Tax=Phytophthora boehmeriae TaxID=109152 RepID=A0A8T1WPR1_9STRA|nr:hypothetical protein PHYBOEH_003751 [Phytophthora boehmeriae]
MVAVDRDDSATWYEAYAPGEEGEQRMLQRLAMESEGIEDDGDGSDEEEEEIEELVDDEPMRVTGRLFVGSIDAARNANALKRLCIRGVMSLLGKGEEKDAISTSPVPLDDDYAKLQITRKTIEMEDSADGELLLRLPEILDALAELLKLAQRDDTNVLVHCIAGRSRSVSVLVARMIADNPKQQSVQDAVDEIRIIRPWIEINPHFIRDLHLFHAALISTDGASLSHEQVSMLHNRPFPRLDFGANLVDGILQGSKTITMRLLSDITDDHNSDLGDIYTYGLVAATAQSDHDSPRARFAFLRIDQIETTELCAIDAATLHRSGFDTVEEVLKVLQQFYPNVTVTTPLLMIHFRSLGFS